MIKKKTSWEMCPRFERCSVNNCPLHPQYNLKLKSYSFDPEGIKCKQVKRIRVRIGRQFKLKNKGLTPREIQGKILSTKIKNYQKSTKGNEVKTPLNTELNKTKDPTYPSGDSNESSVIQSKLWEDKE